MHEILAKLFIKKSPDVSKTTQEEKCNSVSAGHFRITEPMSPQLLLLPAQEPQKVKPKKCYGTVTGRYSLGTPLTGELLAVHSCWGEGESFFLNLLYGNFIRVCDVFWSNLCPILFLPTPPNPNHHFSLSMSYALFKTH